MIKVSKIKQKMSDRSGFTLAEVLLTVAIIIVLCALGFMGYMHWLRLARFQHNNDTAATVFSVLQSELSERRASNNLDEISTRLERGSVPAFYGRLDPHLENIVTEDGALGVSYDQIYSGYTIRTDSESKDATTIGKGPIYYVKGTAEDWANYRAYQDAKSCNDAAAEKAYLDKMDERLKIVYDMLYDYMFTGDYSLLDGSICVEFDPAEGLVYSVFFSEQASKLSYTGSKEEVNLINRTRSARAGHRTGEGLFAGYDLVGYCGVDNLSLSTTKKPTKPIIQNLKLNNEETLNLTFNLNTTMATEAMTFHIAVYNSKDKVKLLDIDINRIKGEGVDTSKTAIYKIYKETDGSRKMVDCRVTRYDETGATAIDTQIMTFPAWVTKDGTFTLVLDALDYNATSGAMQTAYADSLAPIFRENKGKIVQALANTFSIYRLGIQNADEIYCMVQGDGGGFAPTSIRSSNSADRAFETPAIERVDTPQEKEYLIANARHLNNLRFVETEREKLYPNEQALELAPKSVYTLTKDIDLKNFRVDGDFQVYSNYRWSEFEAPQLGVANKSTIGYLSSTGEVRYHANDETLARTFPSFPKLGKKSFLTSRTKGGNSLKNFIITKDANIERLGFTAASDEDKNGTALFLLNEGTIGEIQEEQAFSFFASTNTTSNIRLTDVTVNGIPTAASEASNLEDYSSDRTGAFCGTNKGTLNKLETVATKPGDAKITGERYVGGIFGYFEKDKAETEETEIKDLTNGAEVNGKRYVGGIVGLASGKGTEIKENEVVSVTYNVIVENCKNFGAVKATPNTATDTEVRAYIGGIVGLVDDAAVKNCVSNPQFDGEPDEDDYYGYCVGGIVGLAYNTELTGCNTETQQGYDRGYVVGNRYVGGIVGLCVGRSVISGEKGRNAVNDANVVGHDLVGGIVGCNAVVKVLEDVEIVLGKTEFEDHPDENTLTEYIADYSDPGESWYDDLDPESLCPASDRPTESQDVNTITVRFWDNRGTVLANGYNVLEGETTKKIDGHYAGGITGYNTGTIFDCISSVHESTGNKGDCDYSGGIAGYNNGTLASIDGDELDVECYVSGKNYVGGIVGYNDVDAIVKNYKVGGGHVLGTGNFVGGYAGMNASIALLEDTFTKAALDIKANLNEIEGVYAVGGIIGGNVVPIRQADAATPVKGQFNVENFLGTINGSGAAVGGYIGFNALPVVQIGAEATYRDDLRGKLTKANKELTPESAKNIRNVIVDDYTAPGMAGQNKALAILETAVKGDSTQSAILTIGADNENLTSTYSSGISGKIAVGGVIGYSSRYTTLNVKNVTNKVPVQATEYVPYGQLTGSGSSVLFAQLRPSAIYNGEERYSLLGGIVGIVNEKTKLTNCYNADIGDVNGQGTYTGGLAEANLGTIENCSIVSLGSTDKDNVGGLVGINFGNITGSKADKATVTGRYSVGGIAAENYGSIQPNGEITAFTVRGSGGIERQDGDVTRYISGVGGLVGYNGVSAEWMGTERLTGSINTGTLEITVAANGQNVGGVVGHNAGGQVTMSGAVNDKSSVTGGYAVGGIMGLHDSGILTGFVNQGAVTATGAASGSRAAGDAAGIVGEVGSSAKLTQCVNSGAIMATAGNAAGIVAKNTATVSQCSNYGNIDAPGGSAGGICVENVIPAGGNPQNDGKIENCAVIAPIVETTTDSWWTGIPDWIKTLFNGKEKSKVVVHGRINVGGIAAVNSGTVSGSILKNLTVENYTNSQSTSSVGGVVGVNGILEANGAANVNANNKDVKLDVSGITYADVEVITNVNGAALGGIVGTNYGEISGGTTEKTEGDQEKKSYTTLGGSATETKKTNDISTNYTVYEYIQTQSGSNNTSGSYFTTNVLPDQDTKVVFDGYVAAGDTALFGSRLKPANKAYSVQYANISSQNKQYRGDYLTSQQALSAELEAGERATFTMTNKGLTAKRQSDSREFTITHSNKGVLNSDYALYICALNTAGKVSNLGQVCMYSMEIYKNDVLVHKYLPASVIKDGQTVYGILDVADAEKTRNPDNLVFTRYSSTDPDQYGVDTPASGNPYVISGGTTTEVVKGFDLVTGNNVTVANIGTIAGVNGANATGKAASIHHIQLLGSGFGNSTQNLLGGENYGYGGVAGLNGGEITDCAFNGTVSVQGSNAAVANVGGIAGKNLQNGRIVECTVGLFPDPAALPEGMNRPDSVLKAKTFGYVGGMAGWNFGEILSCNSFAQDSNTSVTVHVRAGHVGGITGFAAAGSLVNGTKEKHTATGSGWFVKSDIFSNDCGTGGIIGYSESGNRGQYLQYLDNYATVNYYGAAGTGNSAVGGIIGRFQNNENGNMVLYSCTNSGSLTGTLVGGMVGRLKYYGATFQSCINKSAQSIISGTTAGGIMGDSYDATSNSTFNSCINFGTIKGGSYGGGIVGNIANSGTKRQAVFFGCVNAGEVSHAGIAYKNTEESTFIRCRNYGKVGTKNTGAGISNSFKSGTPNDRGMVDCFDFRQVDGSILSSTDRTSVDSYFFSGELTGDAKTAMEAWIKSNKQLGSNNPASMLAEDAGKAQHSGDKDKCGLPLSYYQDDGKIQLTSYKVNSVSSNPLASLGIPGYGRAASLNEISYTSMEVTATGPNQISLVEQYYRDKYTGTIKPSNSAVRISELTQTGNSLTAKWNAVTGAYAYKVYYKITEKDNTTVHYCLAPVVYTNTWTMSIPAEWAEGTIDLYVRALDGEESFDAVDPREEEIPPYVNWTPTTPGGATSPVTCDETDTEEEKKVNYCWGAYNKTILPILPTPDVYLELDGVMNSDMSTTTGHFIAVLRNTEDYDAYMSAAHAESVTVTVTGATSELNITYTGSRMSANSTNSSPIASLANRTISAVATAEGNTSLSSSQQTWAMSGTNMMNTALFVWRSGAGAFNGFTGTMPAELQFGITLKASNGSTFVYQQSEIVTDRTIQVEGTPVTLPMAVSSNTTRVYGNSTAYNLTLDKLPEDLLEGTNPTETNVFTVRNYPWNGQNNALYYGHVVAAGLTEAELAKFDLKDAQRKDAWVFAREEGTYRLKPGYVIYRSIADDGTVSYEVRYSAILAREKETTNSYNQNLNQVTYTIDQTIPPEGLPSPRDEKNRIVVAKETLLDKTIDSTDRLTQPYAEIGVGTVVGNEYQVIWQDSGEANYDNANYQLKLYGEDDGTRVLLKTTDVLNAFSEDEKHQSCYDSTKTTYPWQFTFVDEGNSWNYDKLTVRVTRVGVANGDSPAAVWPYYNEYTATLHKRFTTLGAPTVTVPGDKGTMDYGVEWTAIPEIELKSGDFLCYEITVADISPEFNDEGGEHTLTQTHVWYLDKYGKLIPAGEGIQRPAESADPTITQVKVRMDDFDGCKVAVSVRALSKTDAAIYRDGAAGVTRELQLAARLKTPRPGDKWQVTDEDGNPIIDSEGNPVMREYLSMTPVYDQAASTPREDIVANGLELAMHQDERYSAVTGGRYELELFIYEDKTSETPLHTIRMIRPKTDPDGKDVDMPYRYMTGYLDKGDSKAIIPNELTTTDGTIIHLADYAGKYLYVSMRATSESNIFSYWTNKNSYDWALTRIPRMKLTAPELTGNETKKRGFPIWGVLKTTGEESRLDPDLIVAQRVVSWNNDDTDGGYILHLTRELDSEGGLSQRSGIEIVLKRDSTTKALSWNDKTLVENEPLELPYVVTIRQDMPDDPTYSALHTDIKAYVCLVGQTLELYLPDNTEKGEVYDTFDFSGAWTQNVTVQALALEGQDDYLTSGGAHLYRDNPVKTAPWAKDECKDMDALPVAVKDESEPQPLTPLTVEFDYDEANQRLSASLTDGTLEDRTFRLMLNLHYKDENGKSATAEYHMTALDEDGRANYFDPATMTETWSEITGADIRIIENTNHALFGNWSSEFVLEHPIYPITYLLNGGVLPEGTSNRTSYTQVSEAITLVAPEKAGFTFIGWTFEGQTTPQLNVEIPQDSAGAKAYTANWRANYALPFEPGTATPETAAPESAPEEQPTLETPEPEPAAEPTEPEPTEPAQSEPAAPEPIESAAPEPTVEPTAVPEVTAEPEQTAEPTAEPEPATPPEPQATAEPQTTTEPMPAEPQPPEEAPAQ